MAAVSASERATVPAKAPKELPGGGKRRILRSDGMTIKVVVYGGSGEIKDDELPIKPHDGNHFTAVKVGLRNMGSGVYRSNLVLASKITNDKGQVFRAAAAGDPLARSMVDRACRALGAGLAIAVNGLNPEVVVVTGGVVTSLLPLQGEIIRRAGEYALADSLAGTSIHFVPGHKSQTVRGGAALVLYERGPRGAGLPR
jgi:hypothetical protein